MKRIPGVLLLSAVVLASPTITGCDDAAQAPSSTAASAASATTTLSATSAAQTTSNPPGKTTEAAIPILSTSGLTKGPAPSISYAFAPKPDFQEGNWRLVHPKGATSPLPTSTMSDFATIPGKVVVATYGTEAGARVDVITRAGGVTTVREGLRSYGLITTPDRSIAGYLENNGSLASVEAGGSRILHMSRVPRSTGAAAMLGSDTCKEQAPEGGGCAVFLNGRPHTVRYTTSHGITDTLPGLVRATDASNRFTVIGLTSAGRHPCGGLLSARGKIAWETCDYLPQAFSPDGRHILADDASSRTSDTGGLAILSRAGKVQQTWAWNESAKRRITDVTWEDSTHVLAVVFEGGRWSILRLGVDGSVERAAGPIAVPQDEAYSPYLLPLS